MKDSKYEFTYTIHKNKVFPKYNLSPGNKKTGILENQIC